VRTHTFARCSLSVSRRLRACERSWDVSNCLRVATRCDGDESGSRRPRAELVAKGTLSGKSQRRVLARPEWATSFCGRLQQNHTSSVLCLKPSGVVARRGGEKFSSASKQVGASSRDSFVRITILYGGLRGATTRLGKASSSSPRNFGPLLNHRSAFLWRGTPGYGLGRYSPVGSRTSIYVRIDQLYGTIPAVPSIYEAY
jgi:hypothetical protein